MRKMYLSVASAVVSAVSALSLGTTAAAAQEYWGGFYAGAHGGYGAIDADAAFDSGQINPADRSLDDEGGLAGVQLGYNIQFGEWVYGFEGDVSFMNLGDRTYFGTVVPTGTDNAHADLGTLASARVRVGYASGPALLFITGGIAFTDASYSACDCETGPMQTIDRGKLDFDNPGFVVGGGLEWGLASNWTLRGEGLFYGFDTREDTRHLTQDSDPGDYARLDDIWVARAALNYRFASRYQAITPLK